MNESERERERERNRERERKRAFGEESRTVKASRPCLLLYRNEWENRRKTLVR